MEWLGEREEIEAIEPVDFAIAVDVFEHISQGNLRELLRVISEKLKPNGRLFMHNNFEQQDRYPMHYKHPNFDAWLFEAGLHSINLSWAVKPARSKP